MKKEQEFYTILVLPGQTAHPYRFSIRKKTCVWLVGFCASVALVSGGLFVDYFAMLGRMADLAHLRRQTATQQAQIQNFAQTIDQLQKQMAQLSELDRKVRAITDMEVAPAGGSLTAPSASIPLSGIGLGGPEPPLDLASPTSASSVGLLASIGQNLKWLQTMAQERQQSLHALAEAAEAQKAAWAATPSIWPLQGWASSGFGERLSPFTGLQTMHHGIDIVATAGTPVVAPAAGLVSTGTDKGLGNYVMIDHGRGLQTYYGHLVRAAVATGQRVERGVVIGYVGNTGLSTGPHLHYEVQVNGRPVNPTKYILDERGAVGRAAASSDAKTPRL